MKIVRSLNFEPFPHFCLFLTTSCNFNCSYCFAKKYIKNSKEYFSINDIYSFLKCIENVINYEVILLGGEPLLNPHISEITKIFAEQKNCNNIVIQSNGSIDYQKKNIPISDKICNILTFHETQKYNNDIFLKNCMYLKDTDLKISFYLDDKSVNTLKLLSFLKNINFPQSKLEQIFINDEVKTKINTRNNYIYFNNNKFNIYDVLKLKLNRFKGYKCFNHNYNVYPGGVITQRCGNFKNCYYDFKFNNNFFNNSIMCDKQMCDCILDIQSLKIKI